MSETEIRKAFEEWADTNGYAINGGYNEAAWDAWQAAARQPHPLDGFKNFRGMKDFFRGQYGLPFKGYIHV